MNIQEAIKYVLNFHPTSRGAALYQAAWTLLLDSRIYRQQCQIYPTHPIFWLFGNTGAGKTTLGKCMAARLEASHLDGDDMQKELAMFDMSPQGRRDRCLLTAERAKNLAGLRPVVVSMITPYEDLREEIKAITGAFFIYLPYGAPASTKNPFELPVLEHLVYQRGRECLRK